MKRTRTADGELHVMVDIETLDTGPRAKILSIGALVFDPWRPAEAAEDAQREAAACSFYAVINAASYDDAPAGAFTESGATRQWWQRQPAPVRDEVLANAAAKPWREALRSFSAWVDARVAAAPAGCRLSVWANSPCFDCVILENAFRQAAAQGADAPGGAAPWAYYMLRDVRTLGFLCGTTFAQFCRARRSDRQRGRHLQQHHALDDCRTQAAFVQHALRKIEGPRKEEGPDAHPRHEENV
jgi:hypothetical protein